MAETLVNSEKIVNIEISKNRDGGPPLTANAESVLNQKPAIVRLAGFFVFCTIQII